MRQRSRNPSAEPIIAALMAGVKVDEQEARDWITNLLRTEREGFSTRILRRLMEARQYHGERVEVELLDSEKVKGIITDETHR
jgi:hypothetical protein